jgi:translation initiation factor 2 subunit 2
LEYEDLLKRLKNNQTVEGTKNVARLELPLPQIQWIGRKTIFRNFKEFPRLMRRDPNKILMFLAKELATAVSLIGERAIFIGRKDKQSFSVLLNRYLKNFVICPVCQSPDTHLEKVKRLQLLVCEACGAKSPLIS